MKQPPVAVNGIKQDESEIVLTYRNDAGNVVVKRTYRNTGETIASTSTEYMYNYTNEEWDTVHSHSWTYDLYSDGKTLKGDESNWDGKGRHWRKYAIHQHYKRIGLRFPNDSINTDQYTLNTERRYESRSPEAGNQNNRTART